MPSGINLCQRHDFVYWPQSFNRPLTNVIPDELLERLLGLVIASDDDYEPSHFHIRYKTLSATRRVCRHWNEVIISMAELWRRIAVDVSSRSSRYPPPDTVTRWIQRTSLSQTLRILISMPRDQSVTRHAHARAIFNVLGPHMQRWGELWFYSEVGVLGFPQDLSKAYNLAKLSIDAGILDEDAIKAIGPSLNRFPGMIRDLGLDVATYDCMSLLGNRYDLCLNRLENLRMQYEGWMQGILNTLLVARTSLISANIYVDGQWSRSPEYHTLDHDVRLASILKLRYLKLEIYDADLGIFNFLEMRALETFIISVNWSGIPWYARSIAPLVSFVEGRSPSLRACTMQFDELQSDWDELVFRSPTLSQLRTYKICNIELGNNTRETIASSASHSIVDRLNLIPGSKPGRYTIGWVDYYV